MGLATFGNYTLNTHRKRNCWKLKSQNVHSVFKFTKMIDGTPKPFGKILETFDRFTLPSKLTVSWHTVKGSEYITNPMRCKWQDNNWLELLGHTSKHCKNPAACVLCSLTPHLPVPFARIFYVHQGTPSLLTRIYTISNTKTTSSHQNKQKKCSFREARTILKQQQNTTTNSTSYLLDRRKPKHSIQLDKSTISALTNVSYFLPKHLCQNWFLLIKPNK